MDKIGNRAEGDFAFVTQGNHMTGMLKPEGIFTLGSDPLSKPSHRILFHHRVMASLD